MNPEEYFKTLKERRQIKHQATRHQEIAAETAKALRDEKSMGIYMKIFKDNKDRMEDLIKCRSWVLKTAKGDKGRMFVKIYKKFVTNQ